MQELHRLENILSELTCAIRGLTEKLNKPNKFHLWLITEGRDESMKGKMPRVTFTRPVAPGFRRAITITPDEPVDKRDDGSFCTPATVSGDSTGTVDPASTATAIKAWINGDGSTGDKVVSFACDGHIGDGDVEVVTEVGFTVGTPDATVLAVVEAGTPDEPIPSATKK